MKKFVLFVLAFVLTGALMAQSPNKSALKKVVTGRETNAIDNVIPANVPKATNDHFIGQTYYDLWSNGVANSKIVAHDDGTISTAWTSCGPAATSRGTGYNYFNGERFINSGESTARIESTRAGWGCVGALTNGSNIAEVLVSHNGTNGLTINVRPQKGTGAWTQSTLLGPNVSGSTALLWPQIATNGNTIHVIACTESDAGHLFEGIQTCLVYIKGTYNGADNTFTWEAPRVVGNVLPTKIKSFSGDSYSMTANGNKVAILVCQPTSDIFYWLSEDNGTTWTTHTVYDTPLPDGYDGTTMLLTDTPYVNDGTSSIAIGNDGIVHVAFGLYRIFNDDYIDGYYYFGLSGNGVVYWNSSMGEIGHYGATSNHDLDPEVLKAHGYKVIQMPDLDGDGEVLVHVPDDPSMVYGQASKYGIGEVSLPQLVVGDGNVYLFYTSITELPFKDLDFNTDANYFYRAVFATKLTNNGANWDQKVSWLSYGPQFTFIMWDMYDPEDISISRLHPSEDVWPVVAPKIVNGKINMMWQTDPVSGCEIKENGNASVAINPSSINFFSINASEIGSFNNIDEVYQNLWQTTDTSSYIIGDGIAENTISKMMIYPNPAVNEIVLEFLSKDATPATMTITNVLGQEVYNRTFNLTLGLNRISTNVSELSNGFYIVNVKSTTGHVTQKLIKK